MVRAFGSLASSIVRVALPHGIPFETSPSIRIAIRPAAMAGIRLQATVIDFSVQSPESGFNRFDHITPSIRR